MIIFVIALSAFEVLSSALKIAFYSGIGDKDMDKRVLDLKDRQRNILQVIAGSVDIHSKNGGGDPQHLSTLGSLIKELLRLSFDVD